MCDIIIDCLGRSILPNLDIILYERKSRWQSAIIVVNQPVSVIIAATLLSRPGASSAQTFSGSQCSKTARKFAKFCARAVLRP